ncbi:hypothetical protein DL766_001149 [Monosporascus sp. MC13-8B]|uniref:DRBM domain-containing protein n=1 Tax=Monosporascus cannonballus TaxID=155416 RepID=A0ABY0HCP8_9PEZI|nr:hypothetical protein DL762_002717 [Monosporascus cannonballus]RYO97651.1 hypothetical protein DL763_002628 [Monosporascus cannonballus]RYP10346.1 hypothetical protein DL765_008156 [Monosporascus sp. GIB2]RYP38070.1 hypothetical protein DL766_001149 [Monosporascus sp. MC13-8B]
MASSPTATRGNGSTRWQQQLEGGRTAWSCIVTVHSRQIQARYWYDGKNLNNAREDAAEAALIWLANESNLAQSW